MGNLPNLENQVGDFSVNVLVALFLECEHIMLSKSRLDFNQFSLLSHVCRSAVEIQYFSLVIYSFSNSCVQFI